MKRAGIPVLVLLGAALALGGCSTPSAASGLSSLERQATDDDQLPDGLGLAWRPEELDQASVRLLATTSGNRIFAGYAKDKSEVCTVYYPARPDQGWFGGCSALEGPNPQLLYMSGVGYNQSMILVRDDADTLDLESTGWIKVGENTLVPAS